MIYKKQFNKIKDLLIKKLGGQTKAEQKKLSEDCRNFVLDNKLFASDEIIEKDVLSGVISNKRCVCLKDLTITKGSVIKNLIVPPWVNIYVESASVLHMANRGNDFIIKGKS
jgi:hypothetical protein